jgi:hypothetical protein
MSVIVPTISSQQARQSSLNLYDQGTKSELFQLKAYVDKAELVSQHQVTIDGSVVNIKNSSNATQVNDIVGTVLSMQSAAAQEVADRKDAVEQEATARSVRDAELTQLISDEQKSREDADAVLTASIASTEAKVVQEISDRAAADTVLDGKISQEVMDRASAMAGLQMSLEAKINVEKGRIDSILQDSTIDLDSFREVVDAVNSLDSSRVMEIATLTANLAQVGASLADLQLRFNQAFPGGGEE